MSVLLLPPLVGRSSLPPEFRKKYPFRSLEDVAIERALTLVSPGTPIAVVLPAPLFSSERHRAWREALHAQVRIVIEIDRSWPGLSPHFQMHVAVFEEIDKEGCASSPLRFFRVPDLAAQRDQSSTNDIRSDLESLLARERGSTRWGFVLREGLAAGDPWVFDLYSPQAMALRDNLRELGDLRPLGELVDFVAPIRPAARRASLLDPDPREGIPLLAARNIGLNGEVHWDQTRYRIAEPESVLQPGDICLRAFSQRSGTLVAAQIPYDAPPLAVGDSVIVLRKKDETTLEEWQVLVEYLPSFRAGHLLVAPSGGNLLRLDRSALRRLPVPVPDHALRLALRKLTEAAADFESWRDEAMRQKRALFSVAGSQEGRIRVLQAGKWARERQRAAKLVEDPSFRIRTQYPHPLAHRWREVEARDEGLEGYQSVLECAEATLCYLALLAIIGARSEDLRIGTLEEIGRRLAEQKSGIGLGDWFAVLQAVGTTKIFRASRTFPFPEVLRVLADDETKDAVEQLKKARNSYAHGRGPKGAQIARATERRCADLEMLLSSVEFLSEYPLRLVEHTKRDSLTGLTQIQRRDLMGDHFLVPAAADQHESPELEAGSLYIVDRAGHYHLARPWLTWLPCPECHRPSAFHPDRYDRDLGVVKLKSLEHGHELSDAGIAEAFRSLGFLL